MCDDSPAPAPAPEPTASPAVEARVADDTVVKPEPVVQTGQLITFFKESVVPHLKTIAEAFTSIAEAQTSRAVSAQAVEASGSSSEDESDDDEGGAGAGAGAGGGKNKRARPDYPRDGQKPRGARPADVVGYRGGQWIKADGTAHVSKKR